MRLVRRDLEDRIGRGVADRLAGPDMLLAEFGDDHGARGVSVAEDARQVRLARSARPSASLGKHGTVSREIAPVEHHRHAGDLPMAGWRVLALRDFDPVAEAPLRLRRRDRDRAAPCRSRPPPPRRARAGRDLAAAAARSASPSRSPSPSRAGRGDMAERVGALVAERAGVLGAADPDGIEHDQDRACHAFA